ncbi:hypothetical protein L0B53_01380 [Vibrio sp. SS-MA-C1-2]|nr:hypothetical protein L0B53_01380 [Vibrio sp. SS-MA-C1-2]
MVKSLIFPKNLGEVTWIPEQLKHLGALPCGYHQYYYKQDDAEKKELKTENFVPRGEEVQAIETELFKLYEDVNLSD